MANIDKVRVLVVGDAGVGKTSLVHMICHNEPIGNPYWTIGCSVEAKLHEYKAGTPAEKTFFIELWDVGGWSGHKNSRSVFYNPVHGIILCHDLTNRKSQQNLRKWLAELLNKDSKDTTDVYDPEQFAGTHIPILVVGTKVDLAQTVLDQVIHKPSSIAEECCADEFNIDCTQVKHLAPGTSNAVKLSKFFDKIIERKYYARDGAQPGACSDLHILNNRCPFATRTLLNFTPSTDNMERVVKYMSVFMGSLYSAIGLVKVYPFNESIGNHMTSEFQKYSSVFFLKPLGCTPDPVLYCRVIGSIELLFGMGLMMGSYKMRRRSCVVLGIIMIGATQTLISLGVGGAQLLSPIVFGTTLAWIWYSLPQP